MKMADNKNILMLLIIFIPIVFSIEDERIEDFIVNQRKLYREVFGGYNPFISAVYSNNEKYHNLSLPLFTIGVQVNQIKLAKVSEPDDTVDFILDYTVSWTDNRISWNPSHYAGIEYIYIDVAHVFVPSVYPMWAHFFQDHRENYQRYACIEYTGIGTFAMQTFMSVVCELYTAKFPFDNQTCKVYLASSSYSSKEINFNASLTDYLSTSDVLKDSSNGEWTLTNISMQQILYDYGVGGADLCAVVSVMMKRNPLYYLYLVVIPSFIINTITLFGVCMKSSGMMDILNIALTNIMATIFLFSIMADKIPATPNIPLLAIYIILNLSIVITALATMLVLPKMITNFLRKKENEKWRNMWSCLPDWKFVTIPHIILLVGQVLNIVNLICLLRHY